MEKDVAVKRWGEWTPRPLRSAVQTLVAARHGIVDEKSYAEAGLQSQIEALHGMLQKLQENSEFREYELRKCAGFDCRALSFRRRLHELGKAPGDRSYREDAGPQSVAMLRGTNESRETAAELQKEYRYVRSSSGNCRSRRMDSPEIVEQGSSHESRIRSEHCKATIRKIVEQVQAETQQWSQMQEILHYVREEMEELQESKDFWENHALHADEKIALLQAAMHEWRQKARFSQNKVLTLQSEVTQLKNAVEHAKGRHAREQTIWLGTHSGSSQSTTPSISAKSSTGYITDSESLDHHEASVDGSEISNQSGEREKVDHPVEYERDKTKDFGHVPMGSPLTSSERTNLRICKAAQSFHLSRYYQPLINKTSKLNKPGSCPQFSSMHFQQNDCVAEQLTRKKSMKKIHIHNSEKNITVRNRLSHTENVGKWDQVNRHRENLGSGKSSTRLPLADIQNTSPIRIKGPAFSLSRNGTI